MARCVAGAGGGAWGGMRLWLVDGGVCGRNSDKRAAQVKISTCFCENGNHSIFSQTLYDPFFIRMETKAVAVCFVGFLPGDYSGVLIRCT